MAKASSENNDLKKILTHLTALDKKVDRGFKQLTTLDKKVDEGHKDLAALDEKVDKGFKEADKQFKEAAEFRQQTETNFAAVNQRMDDEFKTAEQFRQKTKQDFVDTAHNIGEVGSMLYDKIEGYHHEMQAGFKAAADDRQAIRNEMQAGFKAADEFRSKTEENFAGLYREIPEVGNMAYKHSDAHHEDFLKFQQQALAFQQETRAFHEKSENFQNDTRHAFQEISRILERIESKQIIIEEAFKELKTENEELKKAKTEHETTIKRLEQRVAILEAMQS